MNSKSLKIIISLLFLSFVLSGCAQTTAKGKKKKVFQHDTPLIKEDVKKLGKIEVEKSAEMGPKPISHSAVTASHTLAKILSPTITHDTFT